MGHERTLIQKLVIGTTKMGGGVVVANSILLFSAPILTRLYSQDQFGTYGVMVSASSVAGVALFLRYETLIPSTSEHELLARLPGTLVLVGSLTTPFAFLVLWVTFSLAGLGGFLFALLCAVAAASFCAFNALAIIASRLEQYGAINRSRISRNAVATIGQVALSPPSHANGLFLGEIIARLFAVAYLLRSLPVRFKFSRRHFYWTMRRHSDYPVFAAPASLLNAAASNLYAPMVAALFGAGAAGQVFLVYRLVSVPISLLGQTLAVAYMGSVSAAIKSGDYAGIRSAVLRVAMLLAAIALPCFLAIYCVLTFWHEPIFGPGWGGLSHIFLVLSPAFILQLSVSPFSQSLNIFGFQRWQLGWDFIRVILVLTALLAPATVLGEGGLTVALSGYSVSIAAMYAIQFLYFMRQLANLQTTTKAEIHK